MPAKSAATHRRKAWTHAIPARRETGDFEGARCVWSHRARVRRFDPVDCHCFHIDRQRCRVWRCDALARLECHRAVDLKTAPERHHYILDVTTIQLDFRARPELANRRA